MSLTSAKKLLMAGQSRATDPDARALLTRMSARAAPQRVRLIDRTIRDLKTAGVWDRLRVLYFLTAHHPQAAILNWKADQFNLGAVNPSGLAFVTDKGFDVNDQAYWTIGASAGDLGLSLNNAMLASAVNNQTANGIWIGTNEGDFRALSTDALSVYIMGYAGEIGGVGGSAYGDLLVVASKAAAANKRQKARRNGTDSEFNSTDTREGFPNRSLILGGANGPSAPNAGWTGRFRMGAFGLSLTDDQARAFRSIIRSYLEALGNPT